jgi:hypothetical protein
MNVLLCKNEHTLKYFICFIEGKLDEINRRKPHQCVGFKCFRNLHVNVLAVTTKKEELTFGCLMRSLTCNSLYTDSMSNADTWLQAGDYAALGKACRSAYGLFFLTRDRAALPLACSCFSLASFLNGRYHRDSFCTALV